jgi:hypothetical protein
MIRIEIILEIFWHFLLLAASATAHHRPFMPPSNLLTKEATRRYPPHPIPHGSSGKPSLASSDTNKNYLKSHQPPHAASSTTSEPASLKYILYAVPNHKNPSHDMLKSRGGGQPTS